MRRTSIIILFFICLSLTFQTSAYAALSGPPPASGKLFTLLPPGSALPSDAECASRVRRTTWEAIPANTTPNRYVPIKGSDFNIPQYDGSNNGIWLGDHAAKSNALLNKLSGNFTGTTDEILQWAACKWGLDEDTARAQAVTESGWQMSAVGDNGESHGILQVRSTAHPGTFPAASKSTAFNADYTYFRWRQCYEGLVDWLKQQSPNYSSGDPWGCVGLWYTGNWYGSGGGSSASGAQGYIDAVKGHLQSRDWESYSGSQVTNPAPTGTGQTTPPTPTRTRTPTPSKTPSPSHPAPTGAGQPTSRPAATNPTPTSAEHPTALPDCTSSIDGDANCDNKISETDFSIWNEEFVGSISSIQSDFNADGTVSLVDFEIWRRLSTELISTSPTTSTAPLTTQTPTAGPTIVTSGGSLSIRVSGNHFVNQNGTTVRLLGVNRSGTQYMCADGGEFFDGPSDNNSIAAMKAWGMNAVRVNMNEHCWLGLSDIPADTRGAAYQQAIGDYVNRLNAQGMYVIIDMHFNGPGLNGTEEVGAPDRDHAVAYWSSIATYFKNNHAVLFDLYNEPTHKGGDNSDATWICIRDGGTCGGFSFETEGMQQMLNAIRATGATNPVMVSGPNWAGTLNRWIEFKPNDTANQLVASVHVYGQPLGSPYDNPATWNGDMLRVSQQYPVVMGEIGDSDCSHGFVDTLMPWADSHGISYIAWSWIVGNCANEPSLITNYNGTPSNYGAGFRSHLLSLPH